MAVFDASEARFAEAVGALAHSNPFAPERIEHERRALGDAFDTHGADWNLRHQEDDPPNVTALIDQAAVLLDKVAARIKPGAAFGDREFELYEDLSLFVVYHRWRRALDDLIDAALSGRPPKGRLTMHGRFTDELGGYLNGGGVERRTPEEIAHAFAIFFQVRRAFSNIYHFIIGTSRPAGRLRAAVWESIFSCDLRRYRRVLYDRMADYTTLITGESGTGKELVARAVGLSRYIPFDVTKQSFASDFVASFAPVNLAAMSPTLIESELFGHQRGAFTGAIAERVGWFESCEPTGTVFLDEIGELDCGIQVKLLRVLQSRTFSRLGESKQRTFEGKVIAATNRDLARRMSDGEFRADLYYRLCSDVIVAPALRERLADDPTERRALVEHLSCRIVGDEAPAVADEVESWIAGNLGDGYPWPGNVRELEQCVRNVLIRGAYAPAAVVSTGDPRAAVARSMCEGVYSADELLGAYCTIVYHQVGSYEGAARKLGLDRRTVKAKIDEGLLGQL